MAVAGKEDMRNNVLDWIAISLLIIGGINWGLVGLFDFDLVRVLFAESLFANVIYVSIGVAALYMLVSALVKAGEISYRENA